MDSITFGSEPWLQAAAFSLRYEVFVLEQGISPEDEFDWRDTRGQMYFVAFAENRPAGTLRYQKSDPQTLQPDRFCIQKAFRGQGIGRKLLAACETQGKQDGCRISRLSAEMTAKSFYQRNGYQVVSEPFWEDGVLCVTMEKVL